MFEQISKFFILKKNIQKIKEVNDKFVIPANNLEKEMEFMQMKLAAAGLLD